MRHFSEIECSRGAVLGAWGLIFLALATAANASAAADSASAIVNRVKVSYQDLNVHQPRDATVLYQRLRYAAREACQVTGSRDLASRSEERRCAMAALEQAVRAINKPLVTAAHEQRLAKRGLKAA